MDIRNTPDNVTLSFYDKTVLITYVIWLETYKLINALNTIRIKSSLLLKYAILIYIQTPL
jgi:hypothetical protein